jgi:hypothetical protein
MINVNNSTVGMSGIETIDTPIQKFVAAARQERRNLETTNQLTGAKVSSENYCESFAPTSEEVEPLSLMDNILLAMAQPQAVRVTTLAAITAGMAVLAVLAIPLIAAVRHFQRLKKVPKPTFNHNITRTRNQQIAQLSSCR